LAYLNYLASVPTGEVAALHADAAILLQPSLLLGVSHVIAYWVKPQPLGQLLGQAIDGGAVLNRELWHPLRVPVYHEPEAVRSLLARLEEAWQGALASRPVREDDWYRIEIEKVLRLFRHAAEHNECVVSVLEPPTDRKRADRVRIPFAPIGQKTR
jgi:hypothetical protein